jgi:CubicO group peptidase (beta-lactamase class C family)
MAVWVLSLCGCVAGQEPEPAPAQATIRPGPLVLDQWLKEFLDAGLSPALGAGIFDRGGIVALGASGKRAAHAALSVTRDDLWHLGSCTKAMTATLAGWAHDKKKLSLDTTLCEIWPHGVHEG